MREENALTKSVQDKASGSLAPSDAANIAPQSGSWGFGARGRYALIEDGCAVGTRAKPQDYGL